MQVGIYIIFLLVTTLVISKLRDNYMSQETNVPKTEYKKRLLVDSVDVEINNLKIEYIGSGFVPGLVLNRRGSWRMAQGQVFGGEEFEQLKIKEYSKKI